jgi:hypothetical protein
MACLCYVLTNNYWKLSCVVSHDHAHDMSPCASHPSRFSHVDRGQYFRTTVSNSSTDRYRRNSISEVEAQPFPGAQIVKREEHSELLHLRQPLILRNHAQMHILAGGKLYSLRNRRLPLLSKS